MGLKKFKIILDSQVFFAGKTVKGKVYLRLDKSTKVRGIKLKYQGDGRVGWIETHTINGSPVTYSYSNDEIYFKHEEIIFSSFDLKEELAAGEHVFDFESDLPKHLPNSLEGRHGRVRYSVKGVIDIPKKLNRKHKVPFTVVSLLDLNKDPHLMMSVNEEKVKTFWGHLKPLTVKLSLPVRGYVPGQVIPVKIFVTNDTGVEIKKLRVFLKKITHFHTKLKSQEIREVITDCELHLNTGHGEEEASVDLKVPALPPSRMEYCNIIDIDYQLVVEACVESWYHKNLKTTADIVVGFVPLLSYEVPIRPFQLSRSPPTLHSEFRPLGDQPPPHVGAQPFWEIYGGEVPPPIYEETMEYPSEKREKHKRKEKDVLEQSARLEKVGIEDADSDGEITSFAPLYPVFKFGIRNNDAS